MDLYDGWLYLLWVLEVKRTGRDDSVDSIYYYVVNNVDNGIYLTLQREKMMDSRVSKFCAHGTD